MRIRAFDFYPLHLPFKAGFKHAGAERHATQTVLVRLQSDTGRVGMGEGCPREYVSGEDVASCLAFIQAVRPEVSAFSTLPQIKAWVDAHEALIDRHPAAWCAVELALLDLLGREEGVSIEALLSLPELAAPFRYTAVLGDAPPERYARRAAQYVAHGFRDFKVKITGDAARDREKLAVLSRHCSEKGRIRLDANNLWKAPEAVIDYLSALGQPIFALEEPLQPFDFAGLRRIADTCAVRLILDESFLTRAHFALLGNDPAPFIINLRLSKMGGLLRALGTARRAAGLGIPLIVGAHVGETSILSRAALTVAHAFRKDLAAQEGAFGTWLLSEDLVERPLMFGPGGILDPGECLDRAAGGLQLT